MISLKQKYFFLPALVTRAVSSKALGNVLTGGMIASGVSQSKESKEQSEAQQEQMEKQNELIAQQNKQLELLNKQAQNIPGLGEEVSMIKQNQFTAASILSNIGTTAKDLGNLAWRGKGKMAKWAVNGSIMAGVGYGANKWIQHDMKKNNLESIIMPEEEAGNYGYQESQFNNDINYSQAPLQQPQQKSMSFAGRAISFAGRTLKSELTPGNIIMTGGAGAAVPLLSYLPERNAIKSYMEEEEKARGENNISNNNITPSVMSPITTTSNSREINHQRQEKQYSSKSIFSQREFGVGGAVQKGLAFVSKHLGQIGNDSIVKASKTLQESKSPISNWIGKKLVTTGEGGELVASKKALLGTTALGVTSMGVGYELGEKPVKAITQKLDPNAYKYENYKNQQMQMMMQEPETL